MLILGYILAGAYIFAAIVIGLAFLMLTYLGGKSQSGRTVIVGTIFAGIFWPATLYFTFRKKK